MAKASKVRSEPAQAKSEDDVRLSAYYKWLTTHGGQPVSEEESTRIWVEAEQESQPDNGDGDR